MLWGNLGISYWGSRSLLKFFFSLIFGVLLRHLFEGGCVGVFWEFSLSRWSEESMSMMVRRLWRLELQLKCTFVEVPCLSVVRGDTTTLSALVLKTIKLTALKQWSCCNVEYLCEDLCGRPSAIASAHCALKLLTVAASSLTCRQPIFFQPYREIDQ